MFGNFGLTFDLTFGKTFGELWEARSRLNQSRIMKPNTHFAAFFEFYKIYRLLHRSKFKNSAKFLKTFSHFSVLFQNCCTFFANFVKNSPTLMKFSRNFSIFQEKLPKSPRISDFRRFCKAYYRKFHKTIFKKLEKKVRVRPKIRSNSGLD